MLTTLPSRIAIPDPRMTVARVILPCRERTARSSATGAGSGTHRVVATVDVHDLAGRGREEVGEEGDDGLRRRDLVVLVPPERRAGRPALLDLVEAVDRLRSERLQRTGADQVDPDALGTQVACQVARAGLQGGLRHAHPVVRRPGH